MTGCKKYHLNEILFFLRGAAMMVENHQRIVENSLRSKFWSLIGRCVVALAVVQCKGQKDKQMKGSEMLRGTKQARKQRSHRLCRVSQSQKPLHHRAAQIRVQNIPHKLLYKFPK